MARVRKGDGIRDLEIAFVRAKGKAMKIILRITRDKEGAEDILQNTYSKAWKAFNNFKGESSLDTWLCAIARNEALIFLKKRRRYAIHLETLATKAEINGALADDPYHEVRASNIEKALNSMPSDLLKTVLKRRMAGESEREIAQDLNVPEGTIKSRYRRAKEYLLKHAKEI